MPGLLLITVRLLPLSIEHGIPELALCSIHSRSSKHSQQATVVNILNTGLQAEQQQQRAAVAAAQQPPAAGNAAAEPAPAAQQAQQGAPAGEEGPPPPQLRPFEALDKACRYQDGTTVAPSKYVDRVSKKLPDFAAEHPEVWDSPAPSKHAGLNVKFLFLP